MADNQSNENEDFRQRFEALRDEFNDLQLMYDNTLEHGTSLENELMNQNTRITTLQNKMRKYLSPQLYQALLGGTTEASNTVHSRKKLVIYFSDIVGFSDLTDSIEPELLSDILNAYLTRMSEIAVEYGGTIDKFIGDAIMVFFGDPEAADDRTNVSKCLNMALRMREELFRLRELWKLKGINRELQVRAGINIGYCTVGNFGSENRMDYTIIGGQVNLASRLQSSAQPDSIYLSRAAYSLVEDLFRARHVGPITVKGIHAPVDTYELLGLRQEPTTAANPLIQVSGGTITLTAAEVDVTTADDEVLQTLKKALSQALVALSTDKPRP